MPKPNAKEKTKSPSVTKKKKRVPAQEAAPQQAPQAAPTATQPATPATEPTTGSKFRDLMFGGDFDLMNKKRGELDPEDLRRNIFDFSVAPQYFYNHSQSNAFVRNYINSAPGAVLGVDLWLTPYLAGTVSYRFSVLDNVKDSPTADTFVQAEQNWTEFGLKWRRFYSEGADSASFAFTLKFIDHQFGVPATSNYRIKTRIKGPEVGFDLTVPSSKSFFWTAGVNFKPFLYQDEIVGNTDLRTGTGSQAVGVGASLGGEYRLSRKTRAFFNISAQLYRVQYTGTSSANDPVTGSTLTNAAVNDLYYFLDIGFKFGR